MMKLSRTFFLIWMLLALPLQGMAQASMFACHLNGPAADAASAAHTMDHDMHSEHMGSQSTENIEKSVHGCCNCAPACAVELLPSTPLEFDSMQPNAVYRPWASQLPSSADTRRIDRPPKTFAI